jgi:hypothetical protein
MHASSETRFCMQGGTTMLTDQPEHPTRARDVLPDGADYAHLGGRDIRKGTVAAFVANARHLEELTPGTAEFDEVRDALRTAVPQLRAIGLFEVFTPRSPYLGEIVSQAGG